MLLLPSRAVQSPRYRYSGWSRKQGDNPILRGAFRLVDNRPGWSISVLPSGRLWRGRYAGGIAVPSVWRCSALSFGWKSQPAAPVRVPPCEDAAVVIPVSAAGCGSISYRPFLRPFLRPYLPRCVLPQPHRTLQSSVEGSPERSASARTCCCHTAVDLTGGAPELNPHFRYLVDECVRRGIVTDARQGRGVRVAGRWCRGVCPGRFSLYAWQISK